jgi:hypothetical protein
MRYENEDISQESDNCEWLIIMKESQKVVWMKKLCVNTRQLEILAHSQKFWGAKIQF